MKLGAENKKAVWVLVVLGAGALYRVYIAFFAGPSYPTPSSSSTPAASRPADATSPLTAAADAASAQATTTRRAPSGARSDEFHPKILARNVDERPDVSKIDPTLRLDLLARLDKVPAPAGTHNLFQVGVAPVLKGPETTVAIVKDIPWNHFPPPLPPPPGPPTPTPAPRAVPINVKYYGWASPSGSAQKKAYFLDGDEIIICAEGQKIKGHYRVVRIEAGRVVIEDLNDKLRQTLTKVEDAL
ncbi:MAG TPA: hypothetical protein VML19_10065 [Verrucomicrobiae bacterium]|nr:hypothetical protein [Verrucomicrobiae bacterium]